MTTADQAAAREVFYDGGCPICSAEIAQYRKAAPDVSWQDVSEGPVPDGFDRQTLLARFHARRENGEVVSGARAFLAVWRRMRLMRPVAIVLDRQPFIAMLDIAYAGFLKIRPLWRRA